MPKTLKALTKGQIPRTVDSLDDLRANIYKWKTLRKIGKKGSPAVFTVCVVGELIEAWQDAEHDETMDEEAFGGWLYILECYPELFPHISKALTEVGLYELEREFQGIPALLPEIKNLEDICFDEVLDFLKDPELDPYDDRLQPYNSEQRVQISKSFAQILNRLDALSQPIWSEEGPREGWDSLLRYIESVYHTE